MREEEQSRNFGLAPLELIKHFPGKPFATSDRRQWVGLEAFRYRYNPPNEAFQPPSTHHSLLLFIQTPKEFEARSEGINRYVPPPPGAILLVPAGGGTTRWRWSNYSDSLHVFLEPGLIARVAAASFELDPARVTVPALDALQLPQLRSAMLAVNDELTAHAPGGWIAAECLANLVAIHLIRHIPGPRMPTVGRDGVLLRAKLRAVVEFIEEHLDAGLTLAQMAGVAHLSPYHFARQFKAATGMPPHRYVVARRIEQAQRLLQHDRDLSLAEIAASAGFADQSQFSNHFKRAVGVTPRQFRRSAGIA